MMAEAQAPDETDSQPTAETTTEPSPQETPSGARQRLRVIVNRFSGLKPNWNLRWPWRGSRAERENEAQVLIHAINVGQGDAFLIEVQDESGLLSRVTGPTTRMYLIDGGDGGEENTENLHQCLEMKGCLPMSSNFKQDLLNGIILTTPHQYRIAGVTKLLRQVKEEGWRCVTPILIMESFVSTLPSLVLDLFQIMSTTSHRGLTFTPTAQQNPPESHEDEEEEDDVFHLSMSEHPAILCTQGSKKTDSTWTNVLEIIRSLNVLITSGLTRDQLAEGERLRDREIGVFQVPHDEDLTTDVWTAFYSSFSAGFYLISGGGVDGGPKKEILQGIIKANIERDVRKPCTIMLTNSRGLDIEKISDIDETTNWHRSIKICHINDLFHPRVAPKPDTPANPQAEPPPLYSAEPQEGASNTTPPSSNNTVPTAQSQGDTNPTTGETDSGDEGSGESTDEEEDEDKVTLPPPQFVSINPQRGIVNPKSIIEWSPQGYIFMLKGCIERGLVPVSGKPKFPFYYHGTVSIKKESTGHYIGIKGDALPKGYAVEKHLRIICTPVPHKPWKGEELNLCYVLQETIELSTIDSFQKVLFLQPEREGEGLVETERYRMFGYESNQWKIRHYKSAFTMNTVEQT